MTQGAGAWAAAGAVLVVWGLGWSALAIAVIIPHFNPAHHYMYWSDGGVISPGGGHISAYGSAGPAHPGSPVKLRTTVLVLLPVAFLALRSRSPRVAAPGLALRFLSTNSNFWGTQWHYSATLMPIVFVAAIDGLARHPGPGGQAPGPGGSSPGEQAPSPGLSALEQGLGRQSRGRGGQEPGAGLRLRAAWRCRARSPGVTPRRAGHRYAAVAMAAIAALLAFRFPLVGLWNPGTYQASAHVRAEREAHRPDPGRDQGGVDADHARTAGRPRHHLLDRHRREPGPALHRVSTPTTAATPTRSTDVPGFINGRYPGVTYQTTFKADGVYVFRPHRERGRAALGRVL